MNKTVIGIVLIGAVLVFVIIHFAPKRTQTNSASIVLEQATSPSQETPAVVSASVSPANTDENLLQASTVSNGLITLPLNPSFSKQLPSSEDAKKALAMNEQFKKQLGQ